MLRPFMINKDFVPSNKCLWGKLRFLGEVDNVFRLQKYAFHFVTAIFEPQNFRY